MKRILSRLIVAMLFLSMLQTAMAQVAPPQGISYQAVARTTTGAIMANASLSVRVSVLSSISPPSISYQEVHNGVTTNSFGLFTLVIGNGTNTGGGAFNSLSGVAWGTSEHFAKIEVDDGQGFIDMGTMKLWSVPYALFAGNATNGGPTGAQGPTGPAGTNGVDGVTGPTGPQGIQGPQGPTGSGGVGPTGPAGAQGPTGAAGANGAAGAQGPTGPAGANGAAGATGPAGPAGAQGPTGAAGANGATGAQGPTGPAGADGATGATGAPGAPGAAGPTGPAGADGINGVDGATGPAGADGATGPAGADGATGPAGADGINGVDGATGPAGADGATGPAGADGATGPAGADGIDGATGPAGADGATGPAGPTGPQGPTGVAVAASTLAYFGEPQGYLAEDYMVFTNPDISNTLNTSPLTLIGPSQFTNLTGSAVSVNVFVDIDESVLAGDPVTQYMGRKNGTDYIARIDNAPGHTLMDFNVVLQPGDYIEIVGLTATISIVDNSASRIIIADLSGVAGPAGAAGAQGPTGPAGAPGAAGPTGPAGADGIDGVDGATGPAGPAGATGPAGADGINGVDGATGPAGPAGPTGPAGADGINGIDGATGPAGPAGSPGTNGVDGATGPTGADGATGPTGPMGPTGTAANAWDLFGNTATDPNTNYLGTTDGVDLSIRTNATEAIRVTSSQGVGVGTATPGARLGVWGNVGIGTTFSNATTIPVDGIAVEGQALFNVADLNNTNGINYAAGLARVYADRDGSQIGPGLSSIYGFRQGAGGNANGGSSWNVSSVDAAVKGYTYYGNNYTAGVYGANFGDYEFSAGVVGAIGGNSFMSAIGYVGYVDANLDAWGFYTPNDAYIGGNLQYPVGAAVNYVLTSDANGNATWQDPNTLLTGGAVAWNLLGNNGTDPNTNFIGTGDANDLVVRTNNVETARFYQSGNVEFGSLVGFAGNTVQATGNNDPGFAYWNNLSGNEFGTYENADGQLLFQANATTPGNGTVTVVMDDDNYNVGIGTPVTPPVARLQVVEDGAIGNLNVGLFQSVVENSNSVILKGEYTGVTPSLNDVIAVQGLALTDDFYGIGGDFRGGFIGTRTVVSPTGSQSYYGAANNVQNFSFDGTLTPFSYGTFNNIINAGTEYGVFNYLTNYSTVGGSTYGVFNGLPDPIGGTANDGVDQYGAYNLINSGNDSENAGLYTLMTAGNGGNNFGTFTTINAGTVSTTVGNYNLITTAGGDPLAFAVGSYNVASTNDVYDDVTIGGYFESQDGLTGILSLAGDGLGLPISSTDLSFGVTNVNGVTGYGVDAGSVNVNGVYGYGNSATSAWNNGVMASAEGNANRNYGLYAQTAGFDGSEFFNLAVYAEDLSPGAALINAAGYFAGDVEVTGNLAKGGGTFKIDHPLDPENKYLYHSFVESPDMMNVYNGNITTDANGVAVVELPSYFEAENKDFKYQLTVIGDFAQAIVGEKISNNKFTVKTSKPNIEVSWQVTGVRQDPWANAHRVVAEVEKPAQLKGYYVHPVEYGLGKERGINALVGNSGVKNTRTSTTTMNDVITKLRTVGAESKANQATKQAELKAKLEAEKIAHPATKVEEGKYTTKPVEVVKDVNVDSVPAKETAAPAKAEVKTPATATQPVIKRNTPATNIKNRTTTEKSGR